MAVLRYSKEFEEYHSKLFDFGKFIQWAQKPQRKSIRVNSIKIFPEKLFGKLGWEHEEIPWARNCFWVDALYGLGSTIEHALGYYYVQEASSMMPAEALGVDDGDSVLDLCAAPGSKTTQIAASNLGGTIVANEFDGKRIKSLMANLNRMGISNCMTTKKDGCKFSEIRNARERFDKVLVDAPCSEVGTVRKNPDAVRIWTPSYVNRIANLQKRLICSGFECLRKGGSMVYSTCTTTIEENEGVVKFLLGKYGSARLERISLNAKYDKAFGIEAVRVYPWHNDSECAFMAKIRKI